MMTDNDNQRGINQRSDLFWQTTSPFDVLLTWPDLTDLSTYISIIWWWAFLVQTSQSLKGTIDKSIFFLSVLFLYGTFNTCAECDVFWRFEVITPFTPILWLFQLFKTDQRHWHNIESYVSAGCYRTWNRPLALRAMLRQCHQKSQIFKRYCKEPIIECRWRDIVEAWSSSQKKS